MCEASSSFQDVCKEPIWKGVDLSRSLARLYAPSRFEPVKEAARTIKKHVLAWLHSRIANGLLESSNSLLQAAKAKARRYRSVRHLVSITVSYDDGEVVRIANGMQSSTTGSASCDRDRQHQPDRERQ